jgi:hypothetical protein
MKTGFSRICITPALGCEIAGYYEKRTAKGVLDDLYVTAVAFDDGIKKSIIVGVDTCHLSGEFCDEARRLAAKNTGAEFESIMINCSHTHTGPLVGNDLERDMWGDIEYEKNLIVSIARCAEEAVSDLKQTKLYTIDGKAENISFVRRYRMKNGNVQTNPGVDNDNIDHPLGQANDTLKLLKCVREEGGDIYIVNFGTHADTVGGEYISGDWPNFARNTVEGAIPGAKCLFITGAQGDVNHINPNPTESDRVGLEYDTFDGVPRGYEHTKHMGRVVGGEVVKISGKALPVAADNISYGTIEIQIPANADNSRYDESKIILDNHLSGRDDLIPFEKMELTTVVAEARRIVKLKNGPEYFSFTLSAIKVGGVVFASTPGELFTEIGRRIQNESPFENTFICCLTNGGQTYFPTSSAYDEGGYEARSSQLKKGGDEIIISGMKELFEKIK